jgi:hypothetical protein
MDDGVEVTVFEVVDGDEIKAIDEAFEGHGHGRSDIDLGWRSPLRVAALGADLASLGTLGDLSGRQNTVEPPQLLAFLEGGDFLMHDMGDQVAQSERAAVAKIAGRGDRIILEKGSASAESLTFDGEHQSSIASARSRSSGSRTVRRAISVLRRQVQLTGRVDF